MNLKILKSQGLIKLQTMLCCVRSRPLNYFQETPIVEVSNLFKLFSYSH